MQNLLLMALLTISFPAWNVAIGKDSAWSEKDIKWYKQRIVELKKEGKTQDCLRVAEFEEMLKNLHLYQKPQTDAEKLLDKLMDSYLGECLLKSDKERKDHPVCFGEIIKKTIGVTDCKDHACYLHVLTKEFYENILNEQKRYCDFYNLHDDHCLGYEGHNAINCYYEGKEWPKNLRYHTINQVENEALISVISADGYSLYKRRMVKEDGKWKLDAVDCGYGWNVLLSEEEISKEKQLS